MSCGLLAWTPRALSIATRRPAPCAPKYECPSARASARSLSRSPRLSLALWPHQSGATMAAAAELPSRARCLCCRPSPSQPSASSPSPARAATPAPLSWPPWSPECPAAGGAAGIAAGARGRATTSRLVPRRVVPWMRARPLVLRRCPIAADEPRPARNSELPRLLCCNPRQGLRTRI